MCRNIKEKRFQLVILGLPAIHRDANRHRQMNWITFDTCCSGVTSVRCQITTQIASAPPSQCCEFFFTNERSLRSGLIVQLDHALFCKNSVCSASDVAPQTGVCKTFENGVWAREVCESC